MLKETKDNMLEYFLTNYSYTVSEYDIFYNRYNKLTVESIRQIYHESISGKIQSKNELENRLSMKREYEKRRLHANHKKSSKWI